MFKILGDKTQLGGGGQALVKKWGGWSVGGMGKIFAVRGNPPVRLQEKPYFPTPPEKQS